MPRIEALPSCREIYSKILVINWYTRCECKHLGSHVVLLSKTRKTQCFFHMKKDSLVIEKQKRIQHMWVPEILQFAQSLRTSSYRTNLPLYWHDLWYFCKNTIHHGDMDHTKDSAPCNIERHILDICFWSFFLVSFGHLPKKYVFFQRVAYRFAWHEGFIHTSTEYSEMNSEGLIEHDHPSKAHEGLRFSFKFPTFHSKPHTILSSSESSDVHCLIFCYPFTPAFSERHLTSR